MAIRPIDMTITVQQTPEMSRNQSTEAARPEVAHHQFADKLNREVKQQDRQVNQSGKSEEGKIGRDGRGGNAYSGKQQKRKRKAKAEPAKTKAPNGSMFDVSV